MNIAALNDLLSKLPPDVRQLVSMIISVQQEAIAQRDKTIHTLDQRIKELEAQIVSFVPFQGLNDMHDSKVFSLHGLKNNIPFSMNLKPF